MHALRIAHKTWRELLREPVQPLLAVAFPVLLLVVYYAAFGRAAESGAAAYLHVVVADHDEGAPQPEGGRFRGGARLEAALRAATFDGKPVFDVVREGELADPDIALREGAAALLLDIPPTFSRDALALRRGAADARPASVTLRGDVGSYLFAFARSFVDAEVRGVVRGAARVAEPPEMRWEYLPGTGTLSDFVLGVPGVIVFGTLLLVILAATTLVRENVQGTLSRLALSRMRARDLFAGITVALLGVAILQTLVSLGVAMAFGFRPVGSPALAVLVGVLSGTGAIGVGLLVACVARSDAEAASLGSGALVPLAFLSGAVFPMPEAPIATIAGRTLSAYDVLPPAHAAQALRRVLVNGDGAGSIVYELVALTVLSLALLAAGAVLYRRRRMTAG